MKCGLTIHLPFSIPGFEQAGFVTEEVKLLRRNNGYLEKTLRVIASLASAT